MEQNNYIWVITNNKGEFIKACATRERAKEMMEEWRESFIKIGLFKEVSKLDAVYCDSISFEIIDREGNVRKMKAHKTMVD